MAMKVHLPAVTLTLEKGLEYYYANSKFLPIFYRIPKEILEVRGKELMWIPRTPASAFYDAEVIRFVESDIFMNGFINCVAYMVWPYLNVSPKMEVYSNHDTAWIIAYSLPIWIRGFIDYDGMWDARELSTLLCRLMRKSNNIPSIITDRSWILKILQQTQRNKYYRR